MNIVKKKFHPILAVILILSLITATVQGMGITAGAVAVLVSGNYEYTVNDDNTVTVTGYTGSNTFVSVPQTIAGKNVSSVGRYAFERNTNLTMLTIPNGIKSIGVGAFSYCRSLTKVTLPDSISLIGLGAFAYCSNLTGIRLPDSMTEIEDWTFGYCTELKNIGIPESVTSIGENAFYECSQMTIYGKKNSYAAVYAAENHISFTDGEYPAELQDISKLLITLSTALYTYDGTTKKPSVTVKDNTITLKQKKDYDIEYKNNINAGTAKVIVRGIGAYTNSAEKTFTIKPKSTKKLTITIEPDSYEYDGTTKEPAVTVKDGTKTLVQGKNYSVSYTDNIHVGTARAIVTGKGNYQDKTEKPFTITERNNFNISAMTITVEPSAYIYDGTAKKPSVIVRNGQTIVSPDHYKVTYSNNVNVGRGSVIVTGIGEYVGSIKQTGFVIERKSIKDARITVEQSSHTYDGYEWKPSVTVTFGTKTLTKSKDYSVSYADNVNAGTAKVIVTGKGNYIDSVSTTFSINKKSIKNAEVTLSPSKFIYDGTAKRPVLMVRLDGVTLKQNTDYSVAYSNNINVGIATVTITGKNNYKDTIKATFSIIESSLQFRWGVDNWQFENSDDYIWNVPYSEKINPTYLNVLKKNLSDSEYKTIFWGEGREPAWIDMTGGSCYGMAVVAFLAEYGFVNFGDYQANANNLHDLDAPNKHSLNYPSDKNNLSSLITYYQMLQVKESIQQQFRDTPKRSNKENIQNIISLLDKNPVVLVGYLWTYESSAFGQVILAYGYEYGSWTKNSVTYTGRIKVYNPNYSTNNTDAYIYFNNSTYDWIIPGMNLSSSDSTSAKFNFICADINVINDGGYLGSNTSSNDSSGFVVRIDTPVISAYSASNSVQFDGDKIQLITDSISDSHSVTKVKDDGTGNYITNSDSGDITPFQFDSSDRDKTVTGYDLYNKESAYKVTQAEATDMQLSLQYDNCLLSAGSAKGKSAVFDKNGYVEVQGNSAVYHLSMTFNEDCPTDWSTIGATGTNAGKVSLYKGKTGYVLSGDRLNHVCIYACNKSDLAFIEFSTDCKAVYIYEIDKNTIGLKVDTDGNGTHETKIQGISSLGNTSALSSYRITLGSKVTVKASAEGGMGGYAYEMLYKKKSDSQWIKKQDYSTNSTIEIKPSHAADYDICVKVKDSSGTVKKAFFTLIVTDILKNLSYISSNTIHLKETVAVRASAAGGTGNYTYAVYCKKSSDTQWVKKQDFAVNNSVAFKPSYAADYDICVKIKDSSGTVEKKYFTVKVIALLQNDSVLSSNSIVLGDSVAVRCSASGGTSPYTYAVFYKKTSDTNWIKKQDFTTNASVTFKPAHAADYDICVKVKDSSGTVEKKYFNLSAHAA